MSFFLLDLRTNAETARCHEQQSAWRSGSNDPPVQSSFVQELKRELGLRSEAAARKADYSKHFASCLQQPRRENNFTNNNAN